MTEQNFTADDQRWATIAGLERKLQHLGKRKAECETALTWPIGTMANDAAGVQERQRVGGERRADLAAVVEDIRKTEQRLRSLVP